VVKLAAVGPTAGPAHEEREALVESVVRSQKKRIMGRKRSLPDVERVATRVGPLVARALEQPSIQAELRELAAQNGMSLAEYKSYFRRKQEADLLLESGGDPNARSVSNAIGVAQFLAGTARASGGLKVDLPDSHRFSMRIARLQAEIVALEALPEGWTKPLHSGAGSPVIMAAVPAPPAKTQEAGTKPAPISSNLASRGTTADRSASAKAVTAAPAASADSPTSSTSPPAAGQPRADSTTATAAGHASTSTTGADPASPAAPSASPDTAEKSGPAVDGAAQAPTAPAVEPEPAPETGKPAAAAKPAAPVITRDELIGKRVNELRLLEAKRRQVDERYDPAKAIASQTRYLVRMACRYGSLDWVYEAYHGGEGGVRNTVGYYLGERARQFPSTECAIRGTLASRGALERVRAPLSFEDLYFKTTPLAQPAAFSYLYGRSDNHRYYWWKILAAERAIDVYRRDPAGFREQWRALRPGQRLEVVWYPDSKALSFHDTAALKDGYASGKLVRWSPNARKHGLLLGDIAPLDSANAFQYKGLRPEAMGALYRIADLYLANGGSSAPLRVHSLVQTEEYRAHLSALRPPSWMRHPTKLDEIPIDMEPTGLCFDIERPAADWNRKVLEYALGWLADRNQIYWVEDWEQGPRRYHVCPSPEHRSELAQLR
jgi:hypothetical protein